MPSDQFRQWFEDRKQKMLLVDLQPETAAVLVKIIQKQITSLHRDHPSTNFPECELTPPTQARVIGHKTKPLGDSYDHDFGIIFECPIASGHTVGACCFFSQRVSPHLNVFDYLHDPSSKTYYWMGAIIFDKEEKPGDIYHGMWSIRQTGEIDQFYKQISSLVEQSSQEDVSPFYFLA